MTGKDHFDQYYQRRGTNSLKWDFCEEVFGREDILPMWVADADWPTAAPVVRALKERVEDGILGYTGPSREHDQAIVDWLKQRFNWSIDPEWIVYTSGLVPSLHLAVRIFTHPGDEVLLQSPVYPPFFSVIRDQGAQLLNNRLLVKDGGYHMDYDGLEAILEGPRTKFQGPQRTRMLILCSPHNPVGRVWSKEELERLASICIKNRVLVVSDEIHCDLLFSGERHYPYSSLSEEIAQFSITMMAPSKTFNIAGLKSGLVIIPNPELRKSFARAASTMLGRGNILGLTALRAAYSQGGEWLEGQMEYLEENRDYALKYVAERIPGVKAYKPEGTYLLWLDFNALGLDDQALLRLMVEEAGVGPDPGLWFGPGGEGFIRLNFACPRRLLSRGLEQIAAAVCALKNSK